MLDDINITLKKQKIDLNKDYNFDISPFKKEIISFFMESIHS